MKYKFAVCIGLLVLLAMFTWGCTSQNINKAANEFSDEPNRFNVLFKNDTNLVACYILYWWDHGMGDRQPAPMCGGELKPGDSNIVEQNYPKGVWSIYWSGCANSEWKDHRELSMEHIVNDFFITTTPLMDIIE
jgi:hypothetical protein